MQITNKTFNLVSIIQDYGFPIVAVFFLSYFIWFLYKYITNEIKTKLNSNTGTLIKLIDRIRMLDNDLIRLRTKVKTIQQLKKSKKL